MNVTKSACLKYCSIFSFGNEESFRDLIAAQFGDSFDLKRLPETK